MKFDSAFNIDDEKYNIQIIDTFNIRFNIDGGDILSLCCESYTSKWIKFDFGYCDETKDIIPFGIINNHLNNPIDVYFEYFVDSDETPLFRIHLLDFKFIGYLNMLGMFNDVELEEKGEKDIDEEESEFNYIISNYVDTTGDDGESVKVLYTFSALQFENCDKNRTRMDKINSVLSESTQNINTIVKKENIFLFNENYEIKNVK
jgi:hypothetical protein